MRTKFKILYPQDYHDTEKAGQAFKPPTNCMVVMNTNGIFFIFCGEKYYPSIQPLSDVITRYDVVWL
jgi:hypothetical protein